ncbi:polysaccharide deacetylase [Sulfobacillus acidophilus DSM 10332]|uniref:Polysaccharide deacetylase n=1 Tax=Sulfobacillus acidophilus (strain ATCC 700253 / DSM 10332 / NAL) TaxID=679936 RepID=G8TVY9_SULAD|nr:polysaccharide deacetylase [Sulfobacillus acidophilus DSM 10332]
MSHDGLPASWRSRWRIGLALLLAAINVGGFFPSRRQPPAASIGVLRQGSPRWPWMAITVDTGTGGDPDRLLPLFVQLKVPVTFFVSGPPRTWWGLATRDGMTVESQTFGYINLTTHTTRQDERDLIASLAAIRQATGRRPYFLRPPYGAVDARVIRLAARLGLHVVLWTPGHYIASAASDRHLLEGLLAHAGPGVILAISDEPPAAPLRLALTVAVESFRAEGYRLVPLAQLLRAPG